MLKNCRFVPLAIAFLLPVSARAEIPLPDATIFGKIVGPNGVPVTSGALNARVQRGGNTVLNAPGSFVTSEGETWYVARIALETNIGAPGPSGLAAREGDALGALVLGGKPVELKATVPLLRAGLVARVDAVATEVPPTGALIFRGDCEPDFRLNITDAVRLLNYLFINPAEPPCLAACDADGSTKLNITDGVYLLSFLFLGGPAPPAPGAECGVDPNATDLSCTQQSCSV